VSFFKEVLAEATFICGNWASFKQNAKSMKHGNGTVVEVSEKFPNRHDRMRALEWKETGHNISQIPEIMGRTQPLVNRLLNPEHQYYQTATTRAEIHRWLNCTSIWLLRA
jgi:hypothetical protein